MTKEDGKSTHWDLMLETAKEVAALENSSHDRLKVEFLEEFGRLPTSELLDYFDDLLKSDIQKTSLNSKKTKSGSQRPSPDLVKPKEEEVPSETVITDIEFAEKIASQKEVTVLGFRQSFKATFGKEPSLELVAHFLKRLAYRKRDASKKPRNQGETTHKSFVKDFVNSGSPTVLTFRRAFKEKFGASPHTEMVTFFLNELSTQR